MGTSPSVMREGAESESTDELIMAPENSTNYRHIASVILRSMVESFAKQGDQRSIRNFVNSCLFNLSVHKGKDNSGILAELGSEAGCACLERILTRPMSVDAGDYGTELSFQYVVLPLIGVLTRESVCQSVMASASNRLYSTVYTHRKAFLEDGVLRCMDQLLERGSLLDGSIHGARMAVDTSLCQVPSFGHALLAISRLIYQIVKRIEDSKLELEYSICRLSDQWKTCLPLVDVESAGNLGDILAKEIDRLVTIVTEARTAVIKPGLESENDRQDLRSSRKRGPNMVHIIRQYDPPGHQSRDGPRHDNDHLEISLISILPTPGELSCTRDPFLPSNCIPEAPHFLPHGWGRQMDIQFRLYREDLMNPLRNGLMAFLDVLARTNKGREDDLLKQRAFKGNNVDVYGNIRFSTVDCDMQGKDFATVKFAQPFQVRNRRHGKRREFWEQSKSRLMQGALVFMVRSPNNNGVDSSSAPDVILGVVADRNIYELSNNWENASIRISLVDPRLYMAMLDATNLRESDHKSRKWFLVEPSGGFLESYRPVLEVLQTRLPSTMPFGKYMAPTKEETEAMLSTEVKIDPPKYARTPGFRFDLSILMEEELKLDVTNPESIRESLNALRKNRELLDETQSIALIDALSREVSLINGPPGTGKTRIGVQLMRVLVHNMRSIGSGPILCICYTNHALDQFLEHLLEEKIEAIIRVGSRSKSEKLKSHTLQERFKAYKRPRRLKKEITALNKQWRALSEKIQVLRSELQKDDMSWAQVDRYLLENHPRLRKQFIEPPLFDLDITDDFATVSHGQEKRTLFHQWLEGDDIEEWKRWNEEMMEAKDTTSMEHSVNPFELLADEKDVPDDADLKQFMYAIPSTDRPLGELLTAKVWEMSMTERRRLVDSWRPKIREPMVKELTQALEGAKATIEQKNAIFKEFRRKILCQTSVIGMTTSGAAKYHELLSAVAPKIIVCEEAGEVVESHILATLSSSTQHLIMIGDHLQLRPQIQTYSLSSESESGRNHKLDISLFERLVTKEMNPFPLPLSGLTIQRRMRPEISSLIRNTLYPHLEDGDNVKKHVDVSGMSSNLYFMDHSHPVDSKDQYSQQSFSNKFEVEMIKALVHYLIMNGDNRPGDIAVLTPYLGQLSKLRASLNSSFVLAMDERDQEQLDIQNAEKDIQSRTDEGSSVAPETVNFPLDSGLTLRTIDNFQGEQAKVVIISLVRSDVREDGMSTSASIGFLKSENRTNVLLSRAQHGMYLIGNANLMEKRSHGIWPQVIAELREAGRVGKGFPVVCKTHLEVSSIVDTPEMLRKVSPNGGCNRPCGKRMSCEHDCPHMCHPGDPDHTTIFKCRKPCERLHPRCNHECSKKCGEPCGDCTVNVGPIVLECGHVLDQPRCYQAKDPSNVACKVTITKKPPSCEHEYVTECSGSDATVVCNKSCGCRLRCGHICTRSCLECQKLTSGSETSNTEIIRAAHGECLSKCNMMQSCGHTCESSCHAGTPCPPCTQRCLKQCAHGRCHKPCSDPCDICLRPCTRECPHQGRCNMPCELPCDRPSCDRRCEKTLNCGHRCPSVCGEECPPQKYCVECKDANTMSLNVSLYPNYTFLRDQDVNKDPVLVLRCGHALAMSVLDHESMKTINLHKLHPEGGALSDAPQCQGALVRCPRCGRSAANLMRYGQRVKYLRLDARIKGEQVALAEEMKEAREQFDKVHEALEKKRARFLNFLLKTRVPPLTNPPKVRRLGKPDRKSFPFPQSDARFISKIYGIPTTHEKAWRTLVDPLMSSIQRFTSVYRKVPKTATKNIIDTTVEGLCSFETNTTLQHSHPSTRKAVLEEAKSRVLSTLSARGYPWDGFVGSILIDSIQKRIHVLFIILSLAFSALKESGFWSGWYWYVEDVINCTCIHVMVMLGIASRGKYKRRAVEARLMYLDLICKRALWMGLRPFLTNYDAMRARSQIQQLQKQAAAEQIEVRNGCAEMGMAQHIALASLLKLKMTKAIKVANREVLAEAADWETEGAWLMWPNRQESGSKYRIQCKSGHSFVVDEFKEPLLEWQCNECLAGLCESSLTAP